MPQLHLISSKKSLPRHNKGLKLAECQFPGALLNLLVSTKGSKT